MVARYLEILHSKSEIFAHSNICMTSCCVNHNYTLRTKLSSVINFLGSGSIFCVFASVASILIGKDDEYEINKNAYEQFGLSVQGPKKGTFNCVKVIAH